MLRILKWDEYIGTRGRIIATIYRGISLYYVLIGAEGRTRTGTDIHPLPPQDSVSTSSTTSAWTLNIRGLIGLRASGPTKKRFYFLADAGTGDCTVCTE